MAPQACKVKDARGKINKSKVSFLKYSTHNDNHIILKNSNSLMNKDIVKVVGHAPVAIFRMSFPSINGREITYSHKSAFCFRTIETGRDGGLMQNHYYVPVVDCYFIEPFKKAEF